MINNKKILAIIPARGGSKRLPNKNVLIMNGKPLISWSIKAGLSSKYIDKVVVSTDDEKIKYISEIHDVDVINRPADLATDTATTFDAIEHTIKSISEKFDYIILLQATSPLRKTYHIDEAIELIDSKNADSIISVSEMEHSPLWSNTLPKDNSMKGFLRDDVKNKRSQELEPYYQLNGAIYISKTEILLKEKTFFIEENIFAYKMNKKYSIDIDEEIDFKIAEGIMEYINEEDNTLKNK